MYPAHILRRPAATSVLLVCVLALASIAAVTPHAGAQPPMGIQEIALNPSTLSAGVDGGLSISADGSTVVLTSAAELTPSAGAGGRTNDLHIFAYDVASGAFEQIDVLPNGRSSDQGNGGSLLDTQMPPQISDDGRLVLFASRALDLDPSAEVSTPNGALLYLRDREARTTTLISITDDGQFFNVDDQNNAGIALSGDGTAVAYSTVTNPFRFCGGNTNAVYYYTVATRSHALASADGDGCTAQQGNSGQPSLSRDGRYLAFESSMANVNGIDGGGVSNIWVVDAQTGDYQRVTSSATADSFDPSISADGQRIAFQTQHGYDPADVNFTEDIYLIDRTGGTQLISRDDGTGGGGDEPSVSPHISPSGRYVSFISLSELVGPQPDQSEGRETETGVYRADTEAGELRRIDLLPDGSLPEGSVGLNDDTDVADDGTVIFTGDIPDIGDDLNGGQYIAPGGGTAPPPVQSDGFDGAIASAIDVSEVRFSDGQSDDGLHGGPADYAVLATVENFADALSGSVLAQQGPLLLTRSAALDAGTAAELRRVLGAAGTVYVLGGEAALSAPVADSLSSSGFTVRRLQGASRFETSTAIATEARSVLGDTGEVALARAFGPEGNPTAAWADSVTGGGWAADTGTPIVLTPSSSVHPAVQAFLDTDAPTTTHLLGGEAALDASLGSLPGARRTAGATRFDTARQIALQLWEQAESGARSYIVIDGTIELGWAYGLPAAGLAADADAPILAVGGINPPETLQAVQGCDDQVTAVSVGPIVSGLMSELQAQDDAPCT